jgi:hypothetical protein
MAVTALHIAWSAVGYIVQLIIVTRALTVPRSRIIPEVGVGCIIVKVTNMHHNFEEA